MKILLITKKFPYPLTEGEPIAINYLAKSLVRLGAVVDLLVMNTSKHFFDPANFPEAQNFFREIHTVSVPNHITLIGAMKSLLAGKSYILDRFKSNEFSKKITELLSSNHYDVVQMETIYLAHYIDVVRAKSKAILSVRTHNVEHRIWERVASISHNPIKKWYLKNQNRHLREFEVQALNQFDLLIAITKPDLDEFRSLGYTKIGVVAPVGIDLSEYPEKEMGADSAKRLCFIGALDWMPNQQGLVWFLDMVWQKLSNTMKDVQFHVAGKNTPDWVRQKAGLSAIVHGEVPDAKAFIQVHGILVAPLFSGSGIKIKVLEGMALGRVVVTTEIGAEGIPAINGQHLLIANNAVEFERQLKWCFENPAFAAKIGKQARSFIQHSFDLSEIGKQVFAAYKANLNS
jgi:glycosyltransferase involved in cell wall biosynthesis